MLWPGIKKLGKELQLKRTDSEVVGMVKNCLVRLYDGNNMKILELLFPEKNDNDKEFLINILDQNKIKKYDWLTNGIRIIFREVIKPYSMSKIKDVLFSITDYFEKVYPSDKPQCDKCSMKKNADVYYIKNTSLYLCDDCLSQYESDISNANLKYKQVPTNYLSGFIGALLFSLPGILVTVLLFVFLDRLAALSALLYVFLGMKGYTIFKGKVTPIGASIVIISGLIMVGIGVFTAYSILILKTIESFDIDRLIEILKIPDIQRELRINLIMSYVVSGFYFIFQLFQMMKEWKIEYAIQKARAM